MIADSDHCGDKERTIEEDVITLKLSSLRASRFPVLRLLLAQDIFTAYG
jgi:hypothetical protein